MISNLLGFGAFSARFIPFFLLCVGLIKIHLPREKRYRQLPMIPISIVYGVVLIFTVDSLTEGLVGLVGLATTFIPFLGLINYEYWTLLIANMAVVTLFMAAKGILLPIINGLWAGLEKTTGLKAGIFYEYDEEDERFYLKEEMGQLPRIFRWMYYVAAFYGTILMALDYYGRNLQFAQYRFYPVYGIILFCEIASYLDGETRTQARRREGTDEETQEEELLDFTKLKEDYRQLWPDRLLADTYTDKREFETGTADEIIHTLTTKGNNIEKSFGYYLERERTLEHESTRESILSALAMLRGESVLFADPFYRDLTVCIFFPFNISMLRYGRGLIITARNDQEEEVLEWTKKGFEDICHVPDFWKVAILREEMDEIPDIGILPARDLYQIPLYTKHADFFKEISFVLILEPSRIVTSHQLALSILSSRIDTEDKKVVYCCCDRNADGLVDSLSHILKTSITEVRATFAAARESHVLYWKADGEPMHHRIYDHIVQYLGAGTSIASVALKDGVKRIVWYSDQRFPVRDIRWIDGQYFEQIARYIHRTVAQETVYEGIGFESDIWGVEVSDQQCMIIEDEYNNLFEMGRQFSTRGRRQVLVNVLTPSYLLRDYMADQAEIYMADPKAAAQIVADYARTRRNHVMQLIMLLIYDQVTDIQIGKILQEEPETGDISTDMLESMIQEFYDIREYGVVVRELTPIDEFDRRRRCVIRRRRFTIENERFIRDYATDLKTAYYLAEDDETESHYLGGRLKGHLFQSYLPGEFITLSGKYYEVVGVRSDERQQKDYVIVRRAADHITDRKYYRQLRTYTLGADAWQAVEGASGRKVVAGVEMISGYVDVSIHTAGFLEMTSYNDMKNARRHDVEDIPDRSYRHKYALKLRLPDADASIRVQMALLMNELFQTLFPGNSDYIAAVTDISSVSGIPEGLMYTLSDASADPCIYILEDSQIDLGLVIAVERSFQKILELLTDYVDWSNEKLAPQPEGPDPDGEDVTDDIERITEEKDGGKRKRGLRGLWQRIKDFFARLFKRKKKDGDETEETDGTDGTEDTDGTNVTNGTGEGQPVDGEPDGPDASPDDGPDSTDASTEGGTGAPDDAAGPDGFPVNDLPHSDDADGVSGEDAHASIMMRDAVSFEGEEEEGVERHHGDDEDPAGAPPQVPEKPAHYLQYGYDEFMPWMDLKALAEYLQKLKVGANPYAQTRKGGMSVEEIERTYDPSDTTKRYCDFCGCELTHKTYETLPDGRMRCMECSETAIRTIEELKPVFNKVHSDMETYFGIRLDMPIQVKMVSAETMAKVTRSKFRPTNNFDPRTVGLAQRNHKGYILYVESGSPLDNVQETISHELTHMWQFKNWNKSQILRTYGKQNELEIYEGMAVWTSIQYMMLIRKYEFAKRLEISSRKREDEYGRGFNLYIKRYPLTTQHRLTGHTPFKDVSNPL